MKTLVWQVRRPCGLTIQSTFLKHTCVDLTTNSSLYPGNRPVLLLISSMACCAIGRLPYPSFLLRSKNAPMYNVVGCTCVVLVLLLVEVFALGIVVAFTASLNLVIKKTVKQIVIRICFISWSTRKEINRERGPF